MADTNLDYNASDKTLVNESELLIGGVDGDGQGTSLPVSTTSSEATSVHESPHKRTRSEIEELELAKEERDQWSSKFEFLFSLISMSVGLGNVWRFPVVATANGGGAFLIPYLTVLVFVGRPIYFFELAIGQFSSQTQVRIWNCCPILKGIGVSSMLSTLFVLTYYTSILSVITLYFVESFYPDLPWLTCASQEPNCTRNGSTGSTAKSHLIHDVLHQKANINNGIGYPDWKLTLCLLFAWVVLYLSLIKGVKSSGKVAYFTAIFPYVVLLIFLIRGVTLPGAWIGIKAFLIPDFTQLYKPSVWYAATSQAFFSLNTCFGSVIMFSSYNSFRHNIYRDAIILSVMDTVTSLIAGITVFSVGGYLAVKQNRNVTDILDGESGIAFVAYPTAISELPWPNFFAVLFFLMLFSLGLGSSAADCGTIISIIADWYPNIKRWIITSGVCLGAFLVGILYVTEGGQFLLNLVDTFGASFSIFLVGILEIAGIAYIYKLKNFISDVEFMLNIKLGRYWKICWYGVIPVGLTGVLLYSLIFDFFTKPVTYGDVSYPTSAIVLGWLLALTCLSPIVIFAVIEVFVKAKGVTFLEKLKDACKPKRTWGPRNPTIRAEWKEFKEEHGRK